MLMPDGASAATKKTVPVRKPATPVMHRVAIPKTTSTYVLDLSTDAVRTADRAEVVRPIASLTKLMTAMVLLDAHADLDRTIVYNPKMHYAYRNWMHFATGDRIRGRELLYATLTGSQNIPARMLVPLTPYSEEEFVAHMNAKAQALGLTRTTFVDVHGLNPNNVSTASEVAKMFAAALMYPDINDALARKSVSIVWGNRWNKRRQSTFLHTNVLLKKKQLFAIEASKTGYLHEAGDTIAMRVRDPKSGRTAIVVTLGEPRRAPRFAVARWLSESATHIMQIAGANIAP